MTRDFSNSIFREQDIIDFINEGVSRFKQVIPELSGVERLLANQQEVNLIPEPYQHLLAIYSASRCFSQDENHYQGVAYMNEFEHKLSMLKEAIDNGEVIIKDSDGNRVNKEQSETDYVVLDAYWGKNKGEGVDY